MNWKRTAQWACAASLLTTAAVMADSDGMADANRTRADTVPAADPAYREACGGCHFAYPAALLPAQSWERILTGLSDHFGDNAELPDSEMNDVRRYLLNNAGGRGPQRLPYRLLRSLGQDVAPLRITEIPYFVREHDELPAAAVRDNPQVRSLSHCDACHTGAEAGSFAEQEIQVPGFADRFD